jgi:hypothetical protein
MRTRDELRRDQARAVSRICGGYMMRCLLSAAQVTGGDIMLAVIYSAIIQANVQPLNDDPALSARYAGIDAPPPDEVRRPISVHALAASLAMPYETTRRAVERLIAMGKVRRVSRTGVISTADGVNSDENRRALEQNLVDVARMLTQLRRHGIETGS